MKMMPVLLVMRNLLLNQLFYLEILLSAFVLDDEISIDDLLNVMRDEQPVVYDDDDVRPV